MQGGLIEGGVLGTTRRLPLFVEDESVHGLPGPKLCAGENSSVQLSVRFLCAEASPGGSFRADRRRPLYKNL